MLEGWLERGIGKSMDTWEEGRDMDGWTDRRMDGGTEKLMGRKKHGMIFVCIYKDGWIRISRWINKKGRWLNEKRNWKDGRKHG